MNRISTNIKKDFDSLWAGDESELVAGERSLYTRRPPGTVARAGCSLRRAARCLRSPASQTLPPPQPTAHRTNSTLRLILLLQNKQHIFSQRNPSNLDKYSWVKCWLVCQSTIDLRCAGRLRFTQRKETGTVVPPFQRLDIQISKIALAKVLYTN